MRDTLTDTASRRAREVRPFDEPIHVTRPLLPDLRLITEQLEDVWQSCWLTNDGPKHQLLEETLKTKLMVPHLSLFNNGTIALMVACRSLRLSGEVITTPFTFPATPHVLTWNNIEPVFCDIDPVTMNIDPEKIESLITPRTTGILPVHVFGTPCDVARIQEIADRYGLKVIYDAAHAFGIEVDGTGIGSFGDISMMSFHATKVFHTAEGGALLFRDDRLKERIRFLRNFGIKNEEEVVMPGINGKMSEIQAVIGLGVLECLAQDIARRKELVGVYRSCLADVEGITLPQEQRGVKSNYQYFVIRVNRNDFGCSRDEIHEQFKEYNVFTRKYFYPLCSDYPCYRHIPSASPATLPVAQKVANEVLCLPIYGKLTGEDVERICTILKTFRKKGAG